VAASEPFPRSVVRSFSEEMQVEIRQDLPEAVWIDRFPGIAPLMDSQLVEKIAWRPSLCFDIRLEQSIAMTPVHWNDLVANNDLDTGRRGLHRSNDDRGTAISRRRVRSEDSEWIVSRAGGNRVEQVVFSGASGGGHRRNCTAWQ